MCPTFLERVSRQVAIAVGIQKTELVIWDSVVFKYVLFFLLTMCPYIGMCTYVQVSEEVRGVEAPWS